jgi:hypothetical protein
MWVLCDLGWIIFRLLLDCLLLGCLLVGNWQIEMILLLCEFFDLVLDFFLFVFIFSFCESVGVSRDMDCAYSSILGSLLFCIFGDFL